MTGPIGAVASFVRMGAGLWILRPPSLRVRLQEGQLLAADPLCRSSRRCGGHGLEPLPRGAPVHLAGGRTGWYFRRVLGYWRAEGRLVFQLMGCRVLLANWMYLE